jgi:hypothetical protein
MLAAAILSRNYKGDLPPVEALLRRKEDGRWALGLPSLRVEPTVTASGLATNMTIDLVRGTW